MRITVQRAKFLQALELAASVADPKSKDVLGKVLLVNPPIDSAQLHASNGETEVLIGLADIAQGTAGKMLLDPRRIVAILRESSGDTVQMELDNGNQIIETAEGKYSLPSQNPDEFPSVKKVEGDCIEVPSSELSQALSMVSYAVDLQSTRYQLGGVLIEGTGVSADLVCTDGRRLSTAAISISQSDHKISGIVPVKPLGVLQRALGDDGGYCKVWINQNSASFQTGSMTLQTRLVEGRYPNWRSVVPSTEGMSMMVLDAGSFSQAVKQASVVALDETRGIAFKFGSGSCAISAQTADVGKSAVTVPIASDAEFATTMDFRFVLDWFSRLPKGQAVEMFYTKPTMPTLFVAGQFRYVVMPMSKE